MGQFIMLKTRKKGLIYDKLNEIRRDRVKGSQNYGSIFLSLEVRG